MKLRRLLSVKRSHGEKGIEGVDKRTGRISSGNESHSSRVASPRSFKSEFERDVEIALERSRQDSEVEQCLVSGVDDINLNLKSSKIDGKSAIGVPNHFGTSGLKSGEIVDANLKVFGIENFGNTCYFNSVLQCLYNISEFRDNLLEYPENLQDLGRPLKKEMPGKSRRFFDETSFENNLHSKNGSNGKRLAGTGKYGSMHNESLNSIEETSSKAPPQRRNSVKRLSGKEMVNFYSGSNSTAGSLNSSQADSTSAEREQPTKCKLMVSDSITEKLHENYKQLIVGRPQQSSVYLTVPTHSGSKSGSVSSGHSLTESNGSESSSKSSNLMSSDQRKKAALIRGPILNVDHLLNESEEPSIFLGLKDVFESIIENNALTGVLSPSELISILKKENDLFNSSMHQDAHELLNFLLNNISEHIESSNAKRTKKKNFVSSTFQGILTNSIRCLTCDNVTSNDEPFLDLPIDVRSREQKDIQRIMKGYHQREMLSKSNKFYCYECHGLQEAERLVKIKKLPKILSLHLKRFKYSESQKSNIKLFNKIHYPAELNVSSTYDAEVNQKYELIGVIIHLGGGPKHGHYVSMCKTEKFGWVLFDDEIAEAVSESTVLKHIGDSSTLTTAYVLFYKSIDNDKPDKKTDEQKDRTHDKNIENLLKEDDLFRGIPNKSNVLEDVLLEEVPENTALETSIIDKKVERLEKAVDKKEKRKSRLFSFKRN